jgi:rRNA processing protein Krr1/Pno1
MFQQSAKLTVPLSVRPHLIGKQGQTIQAITKRSGAKINVPKYDGPTEGDDEDATIDVIIEGDAVGAELARREIAKIINERSSGVNMRLKDIPPEYYPFIAGPRQSNIPSLSGGQDLNISIPHYHTWDSAPPALSANPGHPAAFIPQQTLPIRISGDRQAAQDARDKIERQVAALRQQLTSHEVPIERGRHQFILGPDGDLLHDFVAKTGCSIVMPPGHEDSENLYIIGPANRIDDAVNRVMDIAAGMSSSNIDVARQHARAPPSHPYQLARYLQQRRALANLEREFEASVSLPPPQNAQASWQIFARDGKQGMKARAAVVNLIAAHPPSRFHSVEVNPFFHNHLQNQAHAIRREHGVHLLFPPIEDPESHEIILIYERPGSPSEYEFPKQAPSPAQVQEYQKIMQQVVQQILGDVGDGKDIISQHFEASQK